MYTISVCMATLNAASVLRPTLDSLKEQDYPKDKIELIVADGFSSDTTRDILKEYNAIVLDNPLKTSETGKAVAVKESKNDLILILDSDNIFPNINTLKNLIKPFEDNDIKISEPIRYTWRKEGGFIERYCALTGVNDPICLFLGNYDRWNYLTLKWTGVPHTEIQKDKYIKIKLTKQGIPTIGANGVIFRSNFLKKKKIDTYLFDTDIIANEIITKGEIWIAKVDEGIIHTYCESNINKFIKKQKRRINDYLYYQRNNMRDYIWDGKTVSNLVYLKYLKFIIYTCLVFPLIAQSIIGYRRKPDIAWFFHPFACFITLYVYGFYTLKNMIIPPKIDRSNWKQ